MLSYLVSILIWLPIFGGVALLVMGDGGDVRSGQSYLMRVTALVISVLTFGFSLVLYAAFDNAETGMQFV